MQVILKRLWFVGGNRYKSLGRSPVEIPDKYRGIVPKGAEIVKEPVVPGAAIEKKEEPYINPSHALDEGRAFAESVSDVNAKAKVNEQKNVDSLRDKFKNTKKGK